jgi:PRC-barrel domain protein
MSISTDDLGRITQQTTVLTADGDKLGTINQIYTSDTTGEPAWVTLKTGLFGSQESFVPLADASFEGDDIRVPVSKQQVHDAPRVDADGHLSVEEEDNLYRYYSLHNPGHPGDDEHDRDAGDHDDDREPSSTSGTHGGHAAAAGAGAAGAAAAMAGRDRDDDLAQRDVEGRDEVADRPDVDARRADQDDRRTDQDDRRRKTDDDDEVRPGERTTQLRRYVVTERVVRTVEELPDEPDR